MVFLAFSGYRRVRFPTDNAATAGWLHFDRRNEARGESRRDRHDAARGMGYGAAARR
jgi:hypothetical protein